MTGPDGDGLAELQAAEQALAERRGLEQQLEVVRAHAAAAHQRVEEAKTRLASEYADVSALESLSATRIRAALRGSRSTDLEREKAEAQAAEYAAAEALARAETIGRELDAVRARITALGDVTARHAAALELRERFLTTRGGVTASRLTEIAAALGAARAEQVQVEEAIVAAQAASARLDEAASLLGRAGDWAAWDTFGGGGLFTDMMKYNKLDRAAAVMRAADQALSVLARELADVGVTAVGEIGITQMTQAFDVWFDNIFSDWAVRNRISEARGRVEHLARAVAHTLGGLQTRHAAVTGRLAGLERSRLALLG